MTVPDNLELAEKALENWRFNLTLKNEEDLLCGSDDCPFCQHYRGGLWDASCDGCPVSEHTGQTFCDGSPYEDFAEAKDSGCHMDELRPLIQAEVDFLTMIRDKLKAEQEAK